MAAELRCCFLSGQCVRFSVQSDCKFVVAVGSFVGFVETGGKLIVLFVTGLGSLIAN